jgi:hypothetical protein
MDTGCRVRGWKPKLKKEGLTVAIRLQNGVGTPKSPQLPLCLAAEIGATHGVVIITAIRVSVASPFSTPEKRCHKRGPALASRVRACTLCGNS